MIVGALRQVKRKLVNTGRRAGHFRWVLMSPEILAFAEISVRRACRRIAEFPDAALALAGFSFGRFACKAQSLVGLYWDPPFDDRLAPGGSVLRPAKVNSQWLFQMRRSQRDGLFAQRRDDLTADKPRPAWDRARWPSSIPPPSPNPPPVPGPCCSTPPRNSNAPGDCTTQEPQNYAALRSSQSFRLPRQRRLGQQQ